MLENIDAARSFKEFEYAEAMQVGARAFSVRRSDLFVAAEM
jgi:hypothetical protein